MHLLRNEVFLGSLQPLVWRSLRQQVTAPIYCLTVGVGTSVWGVVGVLIRWGARLVLSFYYYYYCYFVCVCVCVCFNNGSLNYWFMWLLFLLLLLNAFFLCVIVKILKRGKKFLLIKEKQNNDLVTICRSWKWLRITICFRYWNITYTAFDY